MVNEGTTLFALHPEWALHNPDGGRVRARNQLVLDFCNGEVVGIRLPQNGRNHQKGRRLREVGYEQIPCRFVFRKSSRRQQGEVTHRYVLGVYSLAQKLVSTFPHLLIEGCSGGGGRFDAGMLYYFPQIWTSDNTDAYCRTFIQYGTSMCYPMSAMSAHYSVCPNHQTGRITSSEARFNVASVCCFGYELDVRKLTEEQREEIKEQIANYRCWQKLVTEGDLYRPCESRRRLVGGVSGAAGQVLRKSSGNARAYSGKRPSVAAESAGAARRRPVRGAGNGHGNYRQKRCAAPVYCCRRVFRDFQTFALHLVKKQ